jgi:aminoglycoside 2'-N-acetyltransferase I
MNGVPQVRVFTDARTPRTVLDAVQQLVLEAFGDRFSAHDWQHTQGGWRIVAFEGTTPVSHAAVVSRELRVAGRPFRTGYLEGVATRPDRGGRGWGSLLLSSASDLLRDRFELGALSTGRHAFYRRLGWQRWRGPTFVRVGEQVVRTPEVDDGVMVLRFGPSADLDLTAPISCVGRPGDDW